MAPVELSSGPRIATAWAVRDQLHSHLHFFDKCRQDPDLPARVTSNVATEVTWLREAFDTLFPDTPAAAFMASRCEESCCGQPFAGYPKRYTADEVASLLDEALRQHVADADDVRGAGGDS